MRTPHLRAWLRHGEVSLSLLDTIKGNLSDVNKLSQLNVLQQVEHLKSYPIVEERLAKGNLRLHAWWFELAGASVYAYDKDVSKFVMIDETVAAKILEE